MLFLAQANTFNQKHLLLIVAVMIVLLLAIAMFTAVAVQYMPATVEYWDMFQIAGNCGSSSCVTGG